MTNSTISKVITSYVYVFKIAWSISKRRVILEIINKTLFYIEWIIYSCLFIQIILKVAMEGKNIGEVLLIVTFLIFGSTVMKCFNQYFDTVVCAVTDIAFYNGISEMLYNKAIEVDISCYEDKDFYNDYMMTIQQAHKVIPESLSNACMIVTGMLASICSFMIIFFVDRFAGLFILFPILGNLVFNNWLNHRLFNMNKEKIIFDRMINYVNRTVFLSDYVMEMRLSNIFLLLKEKYQKALESICAIIEKYSIGNMVLFWLFQYISFTLLYEGAVMYAGYRVLISGTMAFAQMAVFQNIMRTNTWILIGFSQSLTKCFENSLYLNTIQSFLHYTPKISENDNGRKPTLPIYSIEFCNVWFGYKPGEYQVKDINFKITNEKSVALVGYNGAGKSTLIKLLLRLYDPCRGQIKVNGTDIREYHVKAYRQIFATAFQDGCIFADTLENNVLSGQNLPENERKELLEKALKLAELEEIVAAWPEKENTILTKELSEKGVVLSGGQKQKVVMARAFAKQCPIGVFDEPSSALDPIAEQHLFENIRKYGADKIVFFISHRLSSTRLADVVLFMENGVIKEKGTHQNLLEQNGDYAMFYRVQAENYHVRRES